jgi:hypothetical protein
LDVTLRLGCFLLLGIGTRRLWRQCSTHRL